MVTALWVLGGFFIWFLFGCGVLAAIDDDRQELFKWARSCPVPLGYEITVMAWPLILFLWLQRR